MERDDFDFRHLYPFESHYFSLGKHQLHYLDEGQDKKNSPLLMLHGNPTWSFYYRRLVSAFRETHRVVVPDHIGCGFSDKPQKYPYTLETHIQNLEKLVNKLELEDITLVIHDWGGAIGMGFATRNPEKIARVVVLNTSAFLSQRIPFRINICRLPVFGPTAILRFNAFAKSALKLAIADKKRMTKEICEAYLLPYNNKNNRIATLRFVQDIPMSEKVPSYSIVEEIESKLQLFKDTPMLIQWGAKDWCFDSSFLEKWQTLFPGAECDVYEDAGHYVLEDAHERIIPRMRKFLNA